MLSSRTQHCKRNVEITIQNMTEMPAWYLLQLYGIIYYQVTPPVDIIITFY